MAENTFKFPRVT